MFSGQAYLVSKEPLLAVAVTPHDADAIHYASGIGGAGKVFALAESKPEAAAVTLVLEVVYKPGQRIGAIRIGLVNQSEAGVDPLPVNRPVDELKIIDHYNIHAIGVSGIVVDLWVVNALIIEAPMKIEGKAYVLILSKTITVIEVQRVSIVIGEIVVAVKDLAADDATVEIERALCDQVNLSTY